MKALLQNSVCVVVLFHKCVGCLQLINSCLLNRHITLELLMIGVTSNTTEWSCF